MAIETLRFVLAYCWSATGRVHVLAHVRMHVEASVDIQVTNAVQIPDGFSRLPPCPYIHVVRKLYSFINPCSVCRVILPSDKKQTDKRRRIHNLHTLAEVA